MELNEINDCLLPLIVSFYLIYEWSPKFTEIVHVLTNLAESDQEGGRSIVNNKYLMLCNYLFFFIYVTI